MGRWGLGFWGLVLGHFPGVSGACLPCAGLGHCPGVVGTRVVCSLYFEDVG